MIAKLNEWGMKASWQKTRVMRIGRKQEVYTVMKIMEKMKMKYLRAMIAVIGVWTGKWSREKEWHCR